MLKIPKGLKKKKKDKKHKRRDPEDDLFDEAELQRYREEHQQQQQQQGTVDTDEHADSAAEAKHTGPVSNNATKSDDEWRKFNALTAGIDTVLQKTQQDLDRIKSTSFFQRKPPPPPPTPEPQTSSATDTKVDESRRLQEPRLNADDDCAEAASKDEDNLVEEDSENDEEEEVDEDIFDTDYVEAVASGDLKLAYVPDSPTNELEECSDAAAVDGYDPFDTSIADRFVNTNPKKRYLNLGCAVQVLSGQIDKPDPATVTAATSVSSILGTKPKRRIVRPVELLKLTSFDEGGTIRETVDVPSPDTPIKTILDEDPLFVGETSCELPVVPVSVVEKSPHKETPPATPPANPILDESIREELLSTFAPEITTPNPADQQSFVQPSRELFEVFAKSESVDSVDDEFAELAAASLGKKELPSTVDKDNNDDDLFGEELNEFETAPDEVDPFDTSIAIPHVESLPKPEVDLLKHAVVPASLLSEIEDDDFDPRESESPVRQKVTDLPTDIAATPTEDDENDETDDYDPFDTTHVNTLPGKYELKSIERELSIDETDSSRSFGTNLN